MKKYKKYRTVVLGGTFDHFHDGHKAFIDAAARMGQRLLIGVTTKKLLHNKKYRLSIEPLKTRFKSVGTYCKKQGYQAELVELNDLYGPTINPDVKIDALFVTNETVAGAEKIATIRNQLRLKKIPVHIVDLVQAEDRRPIRATRIRAGEISRSGIVFARVLTHPLTLSDTQRQVFSKPQGALITEPSSRPSYKIVVGDSTLETFSLFGWEYSIGVFDGHCERKTYTSPMLEKLEITATAHNPAGTISTNASQVLQQFIAAQNNGHIKITGEEDLLAVAAVILAPLKSYVYYGQPHEGLVEIEVTERNKTFFYNILNQ